jgi:mono/diheme cytochrome c family protein
MRKEIVTWSRQFGALVPAIRCLVMIVIVTIAFETATSEQKTDAGTGSPKKQNDASVARGKYIVEDLAVCAQCHTPRDRSGAYDRAKWLEGASVWLQPAAPTSDWPLQAPRIAGTLPAPDDDMIKLLMTGIWTDGRQLRPPMPQFRMSREDAESVIAYLKTLNSAP